MIATLSMLFFQCGNKDESTPIENEEGYYYKDVISQSLIKTHKTVNDKDQFSYVNSKGKTIVQFGKYDLSYSDTITSIGFVLKKGKGIVAINNKGKEIFNVFVMDNGPDYPVNNVFRIIDKDKIGLAHMSGNIILKPQYDFIRPFSDGYAAFNVGGKKQNIPNSDYSEFIGGKWGLLDQNAVIVIPAIFDEVADIKKDATVIKLNNHRFKLTVLSSSER